MSSLREETFTSPLNKLNVKVLKVCLGDLPGDAVVKTLCSNAGGRGSIPGQGTRAYMHAATKSLHVTTKEPACRN